MISPGEHTAAQAGGPDFGSLQRGLALLVACFAVAELSHRTMLGPNDIAAVWPVSGVAVAGLLLLGARWAPVVGLAAWLFALRAGAPAVPGLVIALGAMLEAGLVARVMRGGPGRPVRFDVTADAYRFVITGGVLAPGLGAGLGVLGLALAGEPLPLPVPRMLLTWWIANGLGTMAFAPALLFAVRPAPAHEPPPPPAQRVALVVAVLLLGATVGVRHARDLPTDFLAATCLFPLALWAAVRHGRNTVAALNAALAVVSALALAQSATPAGSDQADHALLFQLYLALVVSTGLVLSTILAERELSERALKRSEARSRGVLEAGLDAIGVFEPVRDETGRVVDLRFVDWNGRARRLMEQLGSAPRFGQALVATFPAITQGPFLDDVRGCLASGRAHEVEYAVGSPFRSGTHLRVLMAPLDTGIAIVGRDVSASRRLEDELRQAQKMEAVARMAGGVAHDFNNLLTAIGGYAAMAGQTLPEEHPARADVAEVVRATERASALTQQLLAFSRRAVSERSAVDLNALVRETVVLLRPLMGPAPRVELRLCEGPATLLADAGQIQQILMNLALNARDAMPDGGSLVLRTERVEGGERLARRHPIAKSGSWIDLCVADEGLGMTDDVRAHAFEPFFTTRPPGHGTGLGLTIVYGVVQQHGGHVAVESTPGTGTTFHVLLPRHDDLVPSIVPPLATTRPLPGDETVLVVEDEDAIRVLAARTLRARGYRVLEAADGKAALELLAEHHGELHLLLTDVVMPGMSGHELARRARALRPDLRVLAMSGYAAGEAGAAPFDLLAKPFTPDALAERVRAAIDAVPAPPAAR